MNEPNRASNYPLIFRLNENEKYIFDEKLKMSNLSQHEYLTRIILYGYAWYTENEAEFLKALNNTSFQTAMICRNLRLIVKALENEFFAEDDITKIKNLIEKIEKNHIDFVGKVMIDQL